MNKLKRALLLGTVAMSMTMFAACGRKMNDGDIHITMTPDMTTPSPTASTTPDIDILPSIEPATISPEAR